MDFEIVSREECAVVGDREEMFSKLEQDIISQVCISSPSFNSVVLPVYIKRNDFLGQNVYDQ